MSNRDLHNNIHPLVGIAPVAARTDDTAIVSTIVDTAGFNSCEFVIVTGTNTDADATFTVLVQDGDASNLSDAAAVADAQLLGTEVLAGFTFSDDAESRKIGYIGNKRYVRVTVTPSGNGAGNIFLAGVWLLGHPSYAPTPNPPV
jgi:hypothetical protein